MTRTGRNRNRKPGSEVFPCPNKDCYCNPWIVFRCVVCQDLWVRKGYRWLIPKTGICAFCRSKEQKATQKVIQVLLVTGQEVPGSSKIFELLENGVSGTLKKPVEILRVECGQHIFVPEEYQVKLKNWDKIKRRFEKKNPEHGGK